MLKNDCSKIFLAIKFTSKFLIKLKIVKFYYGKFLVGTNGDKFN